MTCIRIWRFLVDTVKDIHAVKEKEERREGRIISSSSNLGKQEE